MHTYVMRCLRGPEPKVLLPDLKPFTRLTNFAHIRIHIELHRDHMQPMSG